MNGKDFAEEFDELDLIETRAREIMSLEADLALYLRKLGLPDTKVVMGNLDEDPLVSVHGLLLTGDEASELIRRLDPKWDGQSCERSWEGLPDNDTLELELGLEPEPEKEPEKKEEDEPPPPPSGRETAQEKRSHPSPLPSDPGRPAERPPPPPLTSREKALAKQALAAARSKGRDTNDPAIRRRAIAASIEALRKKSKAAR